ncbi:FAD-dependent oxidoreductase [Deferribacter thermophilus]|uniref:glycerol-3-phosphate dehydrogenase/oxidase n=1 Tax=Deferribacter thermophilus TaxID=53573 RepID=UPI003C23D93C
MTKIDQFYDLIVIGGGATGAGVALDAASRGLKTLLVEKNDFASGTSSRSTKLLHGGVRYLEAAIKHFDKEQYHLVKDGLKERFILIKNAPHLCHKISLLTPLYKWYELPYVYAGLSIYDLLSKDKSLGRSRIISKKNAIKNFPKLKKEGLKGCVLYFDGQFNDMRMNISILKTAQQFGAQVKNYTELKSFIKKNNKIIGVVLFDKIQNFEIEVGCNAVVNATGPFTDFIRKLDDPSCEEIMEVSSGIHIALDKSFASENTGLLIPKTDDGRVLFVLPWEDACIIGTTDEPAQVTEYPQPKEKEIEYLLKHINRYFDMQVSKNDIKSVWAGLRPLVKHSKTNSTASIVRDHYIEISPSGLITITGGKWTTFRKMAEDTVNKLFSHFNFNGTKKCITENITYYGSNGYNQEFIDYFNKICKLDNDIKKHLLNSYGVLAKDIYEYALKNNLTDRLISNKPIILAEVYYSIHNEFAKYPLDFLVRRTALAETDLESAKSALDKVCDIFAEVFGWDLEKKSDIKNNSLKILNTAI